MHSHQAKEIEMSRVMKLVLALGLFTLVAFGSTPKPGDPAPDFILTSQTGASVKLEDYKGKSSVVLVFYRGDW